MPELSGGAAVAVERVLIWSNEHNAYWRPNAAGYTIRISSVGVYDRTEAEGLISGIAEEKRLELELLPAALRTDNAAEVVREAAIREAAAWVLTQMSQVGPHNSRSVAELMCDELLSPAALTSRTDNAAEVVRLSVIDEIAAERKRQRSAEGWTPEHDDTHSDGELADAAACYAAGGRDLSKPVLEEGGRRIAYARTIWPFDDEWWKPGPTRRRELVKAAALIVAEIERIDRAALASRAEKG